MKNWAESDSGNGNVLNECGGGPIVCGLVGVWGEEYQQYQASVGRF